MSQQRRILERFNNLKPLLGVQDAVCLKSHGPFQAPCGFELLAGTLLRLGAYQCEVSINGHTFMALTVMVCIVSDRRGMQPLRRDEMCPTSDERRKGRG